MAKPDPGTQGPAGPPAQPHGNLRLPLPIKLQHHPVVLEEQARRAADVQLRIADQNRQAAFQQAKADHDFTEQELELKTNTQLTREIDRLTTELHSRLLENPAGSGH